VLTRSYSKGLFEEMPSFNLAEELSTEALTASDLRSGYRFAHKFMTDFSRSNAGVSFTLPDGTRVWRLGIRSPGALSINILFSEYKLPEGAQLFLYNPEQTQVLGAFNHLNNSEPGLLPVAPVRGDELIVEYLEPAQASFAGRLTVGEVNHAYRSLKGYEPSDDRPEFSCMLPPVCFETDKDYGNISRPISELLSLRSDAGTLTLGTTNFTLETLSSEEFYGAMIGDRLKMMFNCITLQGESRRQ
jgi:hypothetical protein